MGKLEYCVGGIRINPETLRGSSNWAYHKFIVSPQVEKVFIYLAPGEDFRFKHRMIPNVFGLDSCRIVGGGMCFLDDEKKLVLGGYSIDYGAVPSKVAM